jgi:uncharacterized protein (TIGR02217 family)
MTASFHEVRFPSDISYGASGGPGFNTTVLTLASGFERRNINWSLARAQYDVAHGLKSQDQLNVLIEFFVARRGKAYGFRFKDWADFQLPFPGDATPVMTTTDGTTATFQLRKVYQDTGNSYTRSLNKIVSGTLTVYNNGAVTTDYTADLNTGIVTLGNTTKATIGHVISATCEFDVPVRFDIDELKASITDYGIFAWGQIPLIEVRV